MTTIENQNQNEKISENEELVKLNKLFANRYTDEDKEYIQMAKPRPTTPPIVNDWGQDKNNYRNQRHYYSNDRHNNNNNNNRYEYQQHRNHSRDNRYRQDRDRSPSYYHNNRQ
ncbi:unnamed protein product [Rotaria sordida]|uniref:Uncharacterized protein n=1 Tax=Rotaria sordida TaxID=392033 RepID=A0A815EGK2_9BILA|nr:unnamed protein product [Rotaria sordida]CAF1306401.1 unnamed protein product [Rotaria sordida]CAF3820698.1 unnamed protein product [Rotaria sordida]